MDELHLARRSQDPGGTQRVGDRGGACRVQAGQGGHPPGRRMLAEHGQRLDERRGAGRQPGQPPFDLARDGVGPELVQPLRRRVGRRAPGRGDRFDQRP
jgi:hypothetical protein